MVKGMHGACLFNHSTHDTAQSGHFTTWFYESSLAIKAEIEKFKILQKL